MRGATGWLVFGLLLLLGSISLLTVVASDSGDSESQIFVLVGSVEAAAAIALLAFGARRGLVGGAQPFLPVRAHTRVIIGISVMCALFVVSSIADPYPQPGFAEFSVALFVYLAVLSGVVALLRIWRSPLARAATAAHNVFWALFFPVGTALWLWWFISLRKREAGAG